MALFDLPATLAAFYFLNSCAQSLPMLANMGFLNVELQMPQETQSLFYAVTFMPWSLKPLYGLVVEMVPIGGYHFRPWLALASAGSAVCYVLMARTVSIGGAFGIALCRAICNAFAEVSRWSSNRNGRESVARTCHSRSALRSRHRS